MFCIQRKECVKSESWWMSYKGARYCGRSRCQVQGSPPSLFNGISEENGNEVWRATSEPKTRRNSHIHLYLREQNYAAIYEYTSPSSAGRNSSMMLLICDEISWVTLGHDRGMGHKIPRHVKWLCGCQALPPLPVNEERTRG